MKCLILLLIYSPRQLPRLLVQSVPITTKVVSSNHAHGEVCSIQHYVLKFVSDLRKIDGLLRVLRVSSIIFNFYY
jgi:hypothetical protein